MGRRIVHECDLCHHAIEDPYPDLIPGSQDLKRLLAQPSIDLICHDCVSRARGILQALASEPVELSLTHALSHWIKGRRAASNTHQTRRGWHTKWSSHAADGLAK